MLKYLRYLLFPFSILYGSAIVIRNKCYDWKLLKSIKFDIPVIVVGNLSIGGAGKSPMTEYLIRLLVNKYKIATLSRGYGRRTSGFLKVEANDDAKEVGDEPLQFKRKFREITVAVCENRVEGIIRIKDDHEVIILDDAFQHRALEPGFSILLFDYESLLQPRLLLPAGNFRDSFSQRKRADVLVVSKSPQQLTAKQKENVLQRLAVLPKQKVLFSFLKYGKAYPLYPELGKYELDRETVVLLVAGIANPTPLLRYLQEKTMEVKVLDYPDHHQYTERDILKVSAVFHSIKPLKKLIVTTEKDAMRLTSASVRQVSKTLPIAVIPIETVFDPDEEKNLAEMIIGYCAKNL